MISSVVGPVAAESKVGAKLTVTDCAVKSAKSFGAAAVSVGSIPELVNATVTVSEA